MSDRSGEAAPHAPEPAVAPPPGNPRFELFDAIRAIAIISVTLFHVCSLTGAVNGTRMGDAISVLARGVYLFFIVSGFLLYRPYALAHSRGERGPSIRRFARRRVLRVVPAYWLALTVLAIFPAISGVFTEDWWRYYFFLQTYSSEPGGLQVAWSLCVEAAFYVCLPFYALGIGRIASGAVRGRWLMLELAPLALLAALGFGLQIMAARQVVSLEVGTSLLGQVYFFSLGMILAVLSVGTEGHRTPAPLRTLADHPGACWLGAAACFIALSLILHLPGGIVGVAAAIAGQIPLLEAAAVLLLTGAMCVLTTVPAIFDHGGGGLPRRILRVRWLAWLGVISYGIYLWHLPLAEFLALPAENGVTEFGLGLVNEMPLPSTPALVVLAFLITVPVAALSYYVVERPLLKRKEPKPKRAASSAA